MKILGYTLMMILIGGNAMAATTSIFPVEQVNLNSSDGDAVVAMIAQNYNEISGDLVITPNQTEASLGGSRDYAKSAASLGAGEYIVVSAVRLSTKISLQAERYSADGNLIHRVKMSILGLDDMEEAGERIAKALFEKKTLKETRQLHTITSREGRVPNRLFIEKINGIKISYIQPVAANETFSPLMRLQYDLRLESENAFFEFGVGLALPSGIDDGDDDLVGLMLEIGGAWYPIQTNISPYIGGGISPRIMGGDGANGIGLAPYVSLGTMFMRESSTRIYGEIRAYQNVLPYQDGFDSDKYYPTEFTFEMGIGW
jgi:hypothetical protein